MRHLYEVSGALARALEAAVEYATEHDGEIAEPLAAELDALEGERAEKIGNICRFIKSLEAEALMVANEAKALSERARTTGNRAAALKGYLAAWMETGEKFADANSKVSWRRSDSVAVLDAAVIPAELMRVIPEERKPDLVTIKAALKAGKEIDGVELRSKQNIQIK